MADPLFTLTAYQLTWLTRAGDATVLAQRIAALAVKHGVEVAVVQEAFWGTGVLEGIGGANAAMRATAQATARGAARRLAELGGRNVMRQAARQVAAHGARTAGATALGGLGATVGTILGVTLVVGVLALGAYAAHQVYTTYQARQEAETQRHERPTGRANPQVPPLYRSRGTHERSPPSDADLHNPRNVIGPHVDDRGREIPGFRR